MAKTSLSNSKIRLIQLLCLVLAILLLTFRLTSTPSGLTVDEASFGYNGVLISRTLHDENGRFMPLFVLSISGKDWRQPITQYFIAFFFKLFSPSSFSLRFTSVLVAILSSVLLYVLSSRLFSKKIAFFSSFLFLLTPIIFIQSHLALDNIMPVPFVILWLFFLLKFKGGHLGYQFLAGSFLGISLYSYKAMRIIVPPLCLSTIFYFYYESRWKYKRAIGPWFAFLSGLIPFFAVMPLLKIWYPGAISGGYQFHLMAWDNFFYPIISTFDPSFLFIKGDSTIYHSTGIHGMFLLASMPLFFIGLYQAVKRGGFWVIVVLSFFTTPFLFGLIDSFYRASRLLAMVPSYILISALGFSFLSEGKRIYKTLATVMFFILLLNFFDFAKYYWYSYPKRYVSDFGQIKDGDYKSLADYAKANHLNAYIEKGVYDSDGEVAHFLEAAYFDKKINFWNETESVPNEGVLLTYRNEIKGAKKVDLKLPNYNLYVQN